MQLDENTFNAYLNEAVKRELNEAGWLPFLKAGQKAATKSAGKKAATTTAKKAAPVVQKSGEAFGNLGKSKGALGFRANSKRVGNARAGLRGAGSERGARFVTGNASKTMGGQKLEYVVKTVKDDKTGKKVLQFLDKDGNKLTGEQLKLARSNFRLRSQQFKDIRKMGNLNRGIALTAIAGGVGTAVAASHSRSQNPDAPWNDTPGDENDGADEGGFDGTFPWDDTTPSWTPKPAPRTAPTGPSTPTEPEAPARTPVEPILPVQPVNMPTGVTAPQGPGLAMRQQQPSLAQSAVQVMGQTANQSDMGLKDRISTNRRTRQNANNAIDQMVRDGSMTRQQARDDKKFMKGAEKALRTGKPMSE